MSTINTGELMLAKARVQNKLREIRELCSSVEDGILMVDFQEIVSASETLHCSSIELLEHCEEFIKSINPSWSRRR